MGTWRAVQRRTWSRSQAGLSCGETIRPRYIWAVSFPRKFAESKDAKNKEGEKSGLTSLSQKSKKCMRNA